MSPADGYPWGQFAWIVFLFVSVPGLVGIGVVALLARNMRRDRGERGPGLWATGGLALVLGFVACAGWLSWTASDHDGRAQPPALPAPNSFPQWQVLACGATVVLFWWLASRVSRWETVGGVTAALGTTCGFSTAFCVGAAQDSTGLSAVGVMMCMAGWGLGLFVLALVRGQVLYRRAGRY